jgi:hypothetical protein
VASKKPSQDLSNKRPRIVEFKKLGRIRKASFEMAPLMVLVGKNNSGKSYAASLLWAILNERDLIPQRFAETEAIPEEFKAIVDKATRAKKHSSVTMSSEQTETWLNSYVGSVIDDFVEQLFSYEGAKIEGLHISGTPDVLIRKLERSEGEPLADLSAWEVTDANGKRIRSFFSSGVDPLALARSLYRSLLRLTLGTGSRESEAVYIPAARTGLMLSLPSLVSDRMETFGLPADETDNVRLPLPLIRFLQALTLSEPDPRRSKMPLIKKTAAISAFVEDELLRGSVTRVEGTSPVFAYQPVELSSAIPLHVASSMVTELAPFLIILRNADLSRGLVFEEPEAHLHLEAQRLIARAIARLVNLGIPVIVTTHSDTFVQQLNLLMSLHGRKKSDPLLRKYRYAPQDLIDPAGAIAYEFRASSGVTEVHRAKVIPEGFVITTLNETLFEISREVADVRHANDD